jgi:hypothetical protein
MTDPILTSNGQSIPFADVVVEFQVELSDRVDPLDPQLSKHAPRPVSAPAQVLEQPQG